MSEVEADHRRESGSPAASRPSPARTFPGTGDWICLQAATPAWTRGPCTGQALVAPVAQRPDRPDRGVGVELDVALGVAGLVVVAIVRPGGGAGIGHNGVVRAVDVADAR